MAGVSITGLFSVVCWANTPRAAMSGRALRKNMTRHFSLRISILPKALFSELQPQEKFPLA